MQMKIAFGKSYHLSSETRKDGSISQFVSRLFQKLRKKLLRKSQNQADCFLVTSRYFKGLIRLFEQTTL